MNKIFAGFSTLLAAGTIFGAQAAQASDYAYLMRVNCKFDNGVTISGTRPAETNAWAPFQVTTTWGFAVKSISLYYESAKGELQLTDRIPGTEKGYVYTFQPEQKPGAEAVETISGALAGPAGKTHGVCELQLADHS